MAEGYSFDSRIVRLLFDYLKDRSKVINWGLSSSEFRLITTCKHVFSNKNRSQNTKKIKIRYLPFEKYYLKLKSETVKKHERNKINKNK